MDRFEEVVDFLGAYSPANSSMSAAAFEQLKEMVSSYLDMEDVLGQSESIVSRLFAHSKTAFMRTGLLVKKDRGLVADLELIEGFVEITDKSQTESQERNKEMMLRKEELEMLQKESMQLRSNNESLTQRCSSMYRELTAALEDCKIYKARCEELDQELDRMRLHSSDTVEHFQTLYNSAIKDNMNSTKKNSIEMIALTNERDQLQREVANLKLELEETIATYSSNGLRISLAEGELNVLRTEYSTLKDKFLRLNEEHSDEVRAYQAEIEDLNYKLIEANKTMKRQDSLNLSVEEHGLDERIFGVNFLTDGFGHEDLERYSQNSTGSRTCNIQVAHAVVKQEKRYSKRNSLVSANQNTTINNSVPSITQQKPPEVDKEIVASLKASIETFKKTVFAKDLEIEELKMQVSTSKSQLSEIINEFTDEILGRDKTIATLRRELRARQ